MRLRKEELRLGNVLSNGENYYIVDWSFFALSDLSVQFFNPIPITHDMLLAIGLEQHDTNKYSHKSLRYIDNFKIREDNTLQYVASNVHIIDMKYLHELQNLIYTLTKKDIEIDIRLLNALK